MKQVVSKNWGKNLASTVSWKNCSVPDRTLCAVSALYGQSCNSYSAWRKPVSLGLPRLRCRHNMTSPYLARDLRWTDETEALHGLRSGSRQWPIMPRTRLSTIGDRSLRVTAARHGTVFHLVSLLHLHWLCSNDNWKHSCLITFFRDYIYFNYVPCPRSHFAYAFIHTSILLISFDKNDFMFILSMTALFPSLKRRRGTQTGPPP